MVSSPAVVGRSATSPIVVKNLYHMFLYAWEMFSQGVAGEVAATEAQTPQDLLGQVLSNGVRRLLRRGIDRSYREFVEETANPRGSFLISETMQPRPRSRGTAFCSYDELDPDVPQNRVIKATLRALGRTANLDPELRSELRGLAYKMDTVSDAPLSLGLFRSVHLSRNNRHYKLLLNVCELIFESLIPGEGEQKTSFVSILEDEERLSALFEKFVRNFYVVEQSGFRVRAEQVPWNASYAEVAHERLLPQMRTDITLRTPGRTIVLDTKYYRTILNRKMGGAEKLRSGHLYQLLTYLRQTVCNPAVPHSADGVLLYARAGSTDLALDYRVGSHQVRVRTIDLELPWQEIHAQLLSTIVYP